MTARVPGTERAAGALERLRIGPIARRAGAWRGVLVLNYHRVGAPDGSGFDPELWSADRADLDRQLGLLAQSFDVVAPSDIADRPSAPGRRVVLTFDDGYRDNYEHALPLLRTHGLPAAFFIAPGFIDEPRVSWWDEIAWIARRSEEPELSLSEHGIPTLDVGSEEARAAAAAVLAATYKALPGDRTESFLELLAGRAGTGRAPAGLARDLWMTWDHARELLDAGMTVGGHTINHPVLARLDRGAQQREIDGCAERLRDELGIAMDFFSYPVGLPDSYDATTRDLLARAGVRLAFSYSGGWCRGGIGDPLAVPRTSVAHGMSAERFAATVTLPQLFARW